ncbi:hypothetical protein [Veronia pacifica]|uniref:Uncharacterized protein n=1 Tax=Veronia pacifica TaxID=1080227 RepID=A0A1C3EM28_9GAMM|nr:hypothetical protein [Veronia pacifica]ODA34279.1 hypothetical protein A8L45_06950 [Veronia pacifica]
MKKVISLTKVWLTRLSTALERTPYPMSQCEYYRYQLTILRRQVSLIAGLSDANPLSVNHEQQAALRKMIGNCDLLVKQSNLKQRLMFRLLRERVKAVSHSLSDETTRSWTHIQRTLIEQVVFVIGEVCHCLLKEETNTKAFDDYIWFWQTWADVNEANTRFEFAVHKLGKRITSAHQSVMLQSKILQKRILKLRSFVSCQSQSNIQAISRNISDIPGIYSDTDVSYTHLLNIYNNANKLIFSLLDEKLDVLTSQNAVMTDDIKKHVLAIKYTVR